MPLWPFIWFALVFVLTLVFWFTWQSIETSQRSDWSYTTLLKQAQQGNVRSVRIRGSDALATDKAGRRWNVRLPQDTNAVAQTLVNDNVDVVFESANSGAYWVQVLVPNLLLLALIGGLVLTVVLVARRR